MKLIKILIFCNLFSFRVTDEEIKGLNEFLNVIKNQKCNMKGLKDLKKVSDAFSLFKYNEENKNKMSNNKFYSSQKNTEDLCTNTNNIKLFHLINNLDICNVFNLCKVFAFSYCNWCKLNMCKVCKENPIIFRKMTYQKSKNKYFNEKVINVVEYYIILNWIYKNRGILFKYNYFARNPSQIIDNWFVRLNMRTTMPLAYYATSKIIRSYYEQQVNEFCDQFTMKK